MKNQKGLTLIEVIVSIAIIGIIFVPLSGVFNTGLTNIVSAGDRTEDMYVLQGEMDKAIKEVEQGGPLESEKTLDTGEKVSIKYEDESVTVDYDTYSSDLISGKLITVELEDDPNKSLTTFVPIPYSKE